MTDRVGRYEVLGEIGRGGFGVVYRAHDPVMHRNVAVKLLTALSDPALLARFRSEAGTTGNLRHKNIITVYDYGEHAGQPFLVMELLEGRSLQEVIRDGPPLSLFEKVSVLLQVAEGLRFAHEQGVVHRDVKPSNVMLLNDGGARILDFGIARFLDASRTRHTTPGFILGTIEYMSPDQLQGVDADPLTDIFSFGVTCYELLSGHQPFRADTVSRIMYLLATVDPAPLCQVVPGCPEGLQHIARTALAKDRSRRYQSVQELLFDLAPIEAALRKERAMDLAAEAGRLIESGDLDHAQSSLNRVLELDPACEKGQQLRREMQRRRERRELLRQAEALIDAGEQQLAAKSFDAAIETFQNALRMVPADAASMRADVEGRLFVASQSREAARRFAALLAEAREAARRGNLRPAHRLAAEAAALDPSSTEAAGLAQQLAVEIQQREAEEERQRRERLRREEAISSVTQAVRAHVNAKRYTDALRLVEGTLGQYPGDEILEKVRAVVREARRRYATELEAERQQAIERQRQAEEQLRLLETERGEESPEEKPTHVPAAEEGPKDLRWWISSNRRPTHLPGAEEGGRGPGVEEAENAPPAPPSSNAGSRYGRGYDPHSHPSRDREGTVGPLVSEPVLNSSQPARVAVISSLASLYRRLGRRTVVLAAAGLVALILVFWLLPQRKQIEQRKPSALAGSQDAIPNGASSAPYSWMASELAGLQDAIPKAIATCQWPQAGADIDRFEQLAPRDPRAAAWRAQVAEGRKADLPVKKDSKREEGQQRELAQAEQLLRQGDYPAAIALFQSMLASDPGNTRARNGLKQATDAKATEDRVFGGGR